jgi:pyrimidine-nucleoside phosphorylase
MPGPERRVEVNAETDGWVVSVATDSLGWAAADLGAGRRTRDELLDHGAGLLARAAIGDAVEAGQPLATLLIGRRDVDVDAVAGRVREAFEIGGEPVEAPQLILGTVDEVRDASQKQHQP